jgi:hypothetical protein
MLRGVHMRIREERVEFEVKGKYELCCDFSSFSSFSEFFKFFPFFYFRKMFISAKRL